MLAEKILLLLAMFSQAFTDTGYSIIEKFQGSDLHRIERMHRISKKYPTVTMHPDHLVTLIDLAYEYQVDPDFALGVIYAESNFKPTAKNPKSSASGYGQLIKSTAESAAKKLGIENYVHHRDAFVPEINLRITVYYLSYCLESSGNISGAIRMYRGVSDTGYQKKVLSKMDEIKKRKIKTQN